MKLRDFVGYLFSRLLVGALFIAMVPVPIFFMGRFMAQRIEDFFNFEPGVQFGKFLVYMVIILVPMAGLTIVYMYFMKFTGLAKLEAYRAALSGNLWARPDKSDLNETDTQDAPESSDRKQA